MKGTKRKKNVFKPSLGLQIKRYFDSTDFWILSCTYLNKYPSQRFFSNYDMMSRLAFCVQKMKVILNMIFVFKKSKYEKPWF